jgi:hypothetical protein
MRREPNLFHGGGTGREPQSRAATAPSSTFWQVHSAGQLCGRETAALNSEAKMGRDPLYDWINGRAIEVFFVDARAAGQIGSSPGWYWWECYPRCLPEGDAFGPFPTSYRAYRDALTSGDRRRRC